MLIEFQFNKINRIYKLQSKNNMLKLIYLFIIVIIQIENIMR